MSVTQLSLFIWHASDHIIMPCKPFSCLCWILSSSHLYDNLHPKCSTQCVWAVATWQQSAFSVLSSCLINNWLCIISVHRKCNRWWNPSSKVSFLENASTGRKQSLSFHVDLYNQISMLWRTNPMCSNTVRHLCLKSWRSWWLG